MCSFQCFCVVHAHKKTVACVIVVQCCNCMHVIALWACARGGMFKCAVIVCV